MTSCAGRIVNVSSILGLTGYIGGLSVYGGATQGIDAAYTPPGAEVGKLGVTSMPGAGRHGDRDDAKHDGARSQIAARRAQDLVDVEDVARQVWLSCVVTAAKHHRSPPHCFMREIRLNPPDFSCPGVCHLVAQGLLPTSAPSPCSGPF